MKSLFNSKMQVKQLCKNIIHLVLLYGFSQLVLVLASPILTRLYPPTSFGYYGFIVSLSAIILPLAALRYEFAIPLVKTHKAAIVIMRLAMRLVFITSAIFAAFFLAYVLLTGHRFFSMSLFIPLIGIIICQGLCQVLSLWLIVRNKVKLVAYGKFIQNISMVLFQIIYGLLFATSSEVGLVLGFLLGSFLNYLFFARQFRTMFSQFSKVSKKHTLFMIKRFAQLPIFTSWTTFLNSLSTLFPVFFIGPIYGSKVLGLYFMVFRVFSAPTGLLSKAVSQILIKEFSDRIKTAKPVKSLFLLLTAALLFIALIYLLFVLFISQHITWVFGQKWAAAGAILQQLSYLIAIVLAVSPLSVILILLEKNLWCSVWQLAYLLVTVIIFMSAKHAQFLPFLTTLVIWSVGLYFLYWLIMLVAIWRWEQQIPRT